MFQNFLIATGFILISVSLMLSGVKLSAVVTVVVRTGIRTGRHAYLLVGYIVRAYTRYRRHTQQKQIHSL
jgi:hypothetical protein